VENGTQWSSVAGSCSLFPNASAGPVRRHRQRRFLRPTNFARIDCCNLWNEFRFSRDDGIGRSSTHRAGRNICHDQRNKGAAPLRFSRSDQFPSAVGSECRLCEVHDSHGLPNTLAGISVTLNQSASQPMPVPLLSIQQVSICSHNGGAPPASGLTADCLITAITVQIPFELVVPPPLQIVPELVVSENRSVSKAFKLSPLTDNLHVINTCDIFPSPKITSDVCRPLVTHADGTLVSAASPAEAGEEIVIWAFGLGQTTPAPKTGQASPTPAATLSSSLYLQFDFRINAMSSSPFINQASPVPIPTPDFAGLTPGQLGLYQINVTLPSTLPAVHECGPTCPGHVACLTYSSVQSNLTIDIGANASFDGAAICVQPGQ
jgi:uncharacterized protein (TIGR03437 family)